MKTLLFECASLRGPFCDVCLQGYCLSTFRPEAGFGRSQSVSNYSGFEPNGGVPSDRYRSSGVKWKDIKAGLSYIHLEFRGEFLAGGGLRLGDLERWL